MKIDRLEIERIAALARLKIDASDADRLAGQIDQILTYMEKLNTLDTSGLEPMAHPLSLTTPFRDDETRPSLEPDRALSNAPEREGDFFVVPRVL